MTAKEAVMIVVRTLRNAGYQALLAGGCVRDMLLETEPYDYDVATDATPEAVTKLFRRTLTVGAQFGVVVALIKDVQIEIATFRSDVNYSDGRRPEEVVFTDAQHDAERRDFTINGMFYDPISEEVIDYVGGRDDLAGGVIRAIGDAEKRFAEDHLRMLRAVRFAGRLGFRIEADTWRAICNRAADIKLISAERVYAELEKIMTNSNRYNGVKMCLDCGLLELIFAEIAPTKLKAGMEVVRLLPAACDFGMALAGLLYQCDAQELNNVCRELKRSNDVRKQTGWLIACHPELIGSLPLSKGKLKLWLAKPHFGQLLELCRIIAIVTDQNLSDLDRLQQQIADLGEEDVAPPPLLDGHAIIKLGVRPGPEMGELLEQLYLAQLEGLISSKRQAEDWIRGKIGKA